jgi:hypothetical protein
MPTLLELQDAVSRALVDGDLAAAAYIRADGLAPGRRLDIYRNTFLGGVTKALSLSYPAVRRLVGDGFFETAARIFIQAQPPRTADLDAYGGGFPRFLAEYGPAAWLAYLPGVARLEWAVASALHAADAAALELTRLAMAPQEQERLVLVPHPAIGLIHAEYPVDAVWRAVLAGDETAMGAIDVTSGPVWLLVERQNAAVDVRRLDEASWRFLAALCAGVPVAAAIETAPDVDVVGELALHLAAGRFVDVRRQDSLHVREFDA